MQPVIRAFDARIDDVNPAERSVVAVINTDEIDRYNTVIDPRGGKFENFRRNPVCLWEHGKDPRRNTDPIGKCLTITGRGHSIVARTQFLKDDFSQQRYEWYRDSVLNGFSVNVLPDMERCGAPTMEELRVRPELERCQTMYRSWDLAEYSGTAIPGNASCLTSERRLALMACVERGLWLPDDVQAQLRTMAESQGQADGGAVVEDKPAERKRYITHSGGKWIVHAQDGKKLGEYDSESEAKKRLEQIEYFKHKDARSIISDGSYWYIEEADGSIIHPRFESARDAEQLLRILGEPPKDFAALSLEIFTPIAEHNRAFMRDVEAYIDLRKNWRV